MYWIIIILFLFLGYLLYKNKVLEAFDGYTCAPTQPFQTQTVDLDVNDVKVCTHMNKTLPQDRYYYPRYKFWWYHIKDLKTRPPYRQNISSILEYPLGS